jgi:hypothetical protein
MKTTSLFAKPVKTVEPHTPLRTAAMLMRNHNVGALEPVMHLSAWWSVS